MNNKQVVAIFIIGVALLLGAFWAGLYVVKQDTAPNANQPAANQNAPGNAAANQSAANQNAQTANDNERFIVSAWTVGTLDEAKKREGQLKDKGYRAAFVQQPTAANPLFQVVIGPYKRSDAEKVAGELSNEIKGIKIMPYKDN
jgi:cell division septation protein DedD